ncbi:MAG: GNAT family N-acetyltransferase [Candidatus Njordarchaeia archaeon]
MNKDKVEKKAIKARPIVKIRRAVPEDKDYVLSFTKDTWKEEGFLEMGDYIQYIWDLWINDEYGELLVADANGKPVAILHMRMLPDGSGWLEGLRVHPNYRKMGIGQKINKEAMKHAKRVGLTVVRGAIFKGNEKAVNLAGKLEFKILKPKWLVFQLNSGDVKEEWINDELKAFNGTMKELVNKLSKTEIYKKSHGLLFYFWSWMKINKNTVEKVLGALGDLRVMELNGQPVIFRVKEELGEIVVEFNMVPDSVEVIKAVLAYLKYNEEVEFDNAQIPVPEGTKVAEKLGELGIKVRFELMIFEGQLNDSK